MFQVGDIVTGTEDNPYNWTDHNAVMEVVGTLANQCSAKWHIGEDVNVSNSVEYFKYYGTSTEVRVKLDKNFNIISEGLTDDEQKDFYIALQEWKPECEGTSTEPRVQEIEAGGESVRTPSAPRHPQLGERGISHIVRAQAVFEDDWIRFIEGIESAERSQRSREQVDHLSDAVSYGISAYQYPPVHDFQERSVNMDRAGEQGRSSHIIERAQRERDRNARLDRFFGRS